MDLLLRFNGQRSNDRKCAPTAIFRTCKKFFVSWSVSDLVNIAV